MQFGLSFILAIETEVLSRIRTTISEHLDQRGYVGKLQFHFHPVKTACLGDVVPVCLKMSVCSLG